MDWIHAGHPGRRVRLAYCLNLHASDDLGGTIEGMRRITLPLAERLAGGAPFGVGLYLPAAVATALAAPDQLATLGDFLVEHQLDPFTYNAFPFTGFHEDGLKEDVFRPTWTEESRVEFTLAVANVATALAARGINHGPDEHVSISTHTGMFGAWVKGKQDLEACARNMARCVAAFAEIEASGGPRIVLSLEAEPRASAGDTAELAEFLAWARPFAASCLAQTGMDAASAEAATRRHLGTCLDTCHAAVEFETPEDSLAQASRGGPLGKLQFASAVSLIDPPNEVDARIAFLDLEEPRYLHQVTGSGTSGLLRCDDLPDLGATSANDWFECEEWRCHFHVPVDRTDLEGGLGTTRAHADRTLRAALADPAKWTTEELHLEIETYTWDVLSRTARGTGDLVDGLEREYRHVMGLLQAAGWNRAKNPSLTR